MTPDVPYRLNLALREVDADVQDLEMATAESHQEIAGRLAVVESAAGFSGGMRLQDEAVTGLLSGDTKTAAAVTKQIEAKGTAAALESLETPGGDLYQSAVELINTRWRGPLARFGQATMNQANEPVIYLNLGSSTANSGNASKPSFGWPYRLGARISRRKMAHLSTVTARPANGAWAYTAAVGGTTSGNYITADNLAKFKILKPTLVTHMVGANDFANGNPPATYKNTLRNHLDQLLTLAPDSVHVLIHQQGRDDIGAPKYSWDKYGQALAEVAAAYPDNVVFFNVDEVFKSLGRDGMMADGAHVNDWGHRVLAEQIAEFLGLPMGYMDNELTVHGTPAGGDLAAGRTHLYATVILPPRPYPTRVEYVNNLYISTNAGKSEIHLECISVEGSTETGVGEFLAVQVQDAARSTKSFSKTWDLEANTEYRVRTTVTPSGAPTYLSSGTSWTSIYARRTVL